MHCIVLHGDEGWTLRRSIEILGYHSARREVVILKTLLVEFERQSRESRPFLRLLHRGNVQCYYSQTGSKARHPDEPTDCAGDTIFWSVYKSGLDRRSDKLFRVKQLSKTDSWYGSATASHEVNTWPATLMSSPVHGPYDATHLVPAVYSLPADGAYVPFTVWELGPLPDGETLVSLVLKFSGQTYDRLLGDGPSFSVDGPRRLLDAIDADISRMHHDESMQWQSRLRPFREFLEPKETYDIIILQPPVADAVRVENSSGIIIAPNQPGAKTGSSRFISIHTNFSLVLEYAPRRSAEPTARSKPRGG